MLQSVAFKSLPDLRQLTTLTNLEWTQKIHEPPNPQHPLLPTALQELRLKFSSNLDDDFGHPDVELPCLTILVLDAERMSDAMTVSQVSLTYFLFRFALVTRS